MTQPKPEDLFGEYDKAAKTGIKREPKVCAVTGRALHATLGTVRFSVPGTAFFYRVVGNAVFTDERRKEVEGLAKQLKAPGVKSDPAPKTEA